MFTIQSDTLSLTVDPLGAQMTRLTGADGTEYLWSGDSAYWGKHAPNLFPIIGRLYEGRYALGDRVYSIPRHGFANVSLFRPVERADHLLALELTETDETLAMFPYHFSLQILYALQGNTLTITYRVENRDTRVMPFALGAHPGFRLPLAPGETFEDYELDFGASCRPDRVGFTDPDVLLSGLATPFPLVDGHILPLKHDLFDDDAIILHHVPSTLTLRSRVSGRQISLTSPLPYLGLWHPAKTDAPFLCVEPWSSLPGRQGVVEDLHCRGDFLCLSPGEVSSTRLCFRFA